MYQLDFRALSCFQGHMGCIYISCIQILLYNSYLLSQAQYVCGIHYHVVYLAHVYASIYYIVQSIVYWTPYSFYFVSAGIFMPPPLPIAQVLTHKRDLSHL